MTLELEGVAKVYGQTQVLRGLSALFTHSDVVAIIGPNGAGKTTLFDVLTGYSKRDTAGHCWFLGADLMTREPSSIARLGVCRTFQTPQVVPSLTVVENIMLAQTVVAVTPHPASRLRLWFDPRAEVCARDAAVEVAERCGLGHILDRYPIAISYGEVKLLALACCVAMAPSLLLLDEPFTGLHAKAKAHAIDMINNWHRAGAIVLIVEHDLDVVRDVANRALLLVNGSVRAEGDVARVIDTFRNSLREM